MLIGMYVIIALAFVGLSVIRHGSFLMANSTSTPITRLEAQAFSIHFSIRNRSGRLNEFPWRCSQHARKA